MGRTRGWVPKWKIHWWYPPRNEIPVANASNNRKSPSSSLRKLCCWVCEYSTVICARTKSAISCQMHPEGIDRQRTFLVINYSPICLLTLAAVETADNLGSALQTVPSWTITRGLFTAVTQDQLAFLGLSRSDSYQKPLGAPSMLLHSQSHTAPEVATRLGLILERHFWQHFLLISLEGV